jgi:hypothetical protein
MKFYSPTQGAMSLNSVFRAIREYMDQNPDDDYRLMIGTDSQVRQQTIFVTAVIIHRIGKGGRYFYTRRRERWLDSLRQRIYYETSLSLEVAAKLTSLLAQANMEEVKLEIHLDIGTNGETRSLIRELVGMVSGSGFSARIKPYAIGASTVADKHTKG